MPGAIILPKGQGLPARFLPTQGVESATMPFGMVKKIHYEDCGKDRLPDC